MPRRVSVLIGLQKPQPPPLTAQLISGLGTNLFTLDLHAAINNLSLLHLHLEDGIDTFFTNKDGEIQSNDQLVDECLSVIKNLELSRDIEIRFRAMLLVILDCPELGDPHGLSIRSLAKTLESALQTLRRLQSQVEGTPGMMDKLIQNVGIACDDNAVQDVLVTLQEVKLPTAQSCSMLVVALDEYLKQLRLMQSFQVSLEDSEHRVKVKEIEISLRGAGCKDEATLLLLQQDLQTVESFSERLSTQVTKTQEKREQMAEAVKVFYERVSRSLSLYTGEVSGSK